jgi:thiol:disulfide interchange protein DsbC
VKNKGMIFVLAAVFVFALSVAGYAASTDEPAAKKPKAKKAAVAKTEKPVPVEEAFKKSFPNIQFDSIKPTDIKGIYEVVAGTNIGYFAPDPGYLILGEIRGKNGLSITAARREELMAVQNEAVVAKVKDFPLDKAIKIGEGKSKVIEFTDPDCPYCRKASEFFAKRTDVTRYVFFMPLPMHPDAENKARYVICATDEAAPYEEAMTGKLDGKK